MIKYLGNAIENPHSLSAIVTIVAYSFYFKVSLVEATCLALTYYITYRIAKSVKSQYEEVKNENDSHDCS